MPAWLVNPVLGVVTLALVGVLGARLYHPRVSIIAAALVGLSPFFAFNTAFGSHLAKHGAPVMTGCWW